MPRGYPIKTSRWFLQHFLLQPWAEHASCSHHLELPWTGVVTVTADGGDREASPSRAQYLAMAQICADCPVLTDCAHYALSGHNGQGVDGGFYAGVWIPWPRQHQNHDRNTARVMLRRHVKINEPLS